VDNAYCAKHRHVLRNTPEILPNRNHTPSAIASGSSQSSFTAYSYPSDDYEHEQWFGTVTSGLVPGQNRTFAQAVVWVFNYPKKPSQVYITGKLPFYLNWAGGQWVAQQVYLYIHIRIELLQIVNSILSKSRLQQPIICVSIFCCLQYQ
jgi:hypothetical protein